MSTFPNSGRLNYSKQKINQSSPDLYGEIAIDRTLLRQMLSETDEDNIVIRLSGWEKNGNYGPWFSIKVNTWKKTEPTLAPQPAPAADDSDDVPF
jgi:hypothetical protein